MASWGYLVELIFGVLIPVAGLAIAVLGYLRSHPKRELRYRASSASLLSASRVAGSALQVTYKGSPVANPHIVTLEVWSSGRADIPSARFDALAPLVFDFGAEIIEEAVQSGDEGTAFEQHGMTQMAIRPRLISKRFRARTQVVLADVPNLQLSSQPIIDVDVVAVDQREVEQKLHRQTRRAWPFVAGVAGAAAVLGFILVGIDSTINGPDDPSALTGTGAMLFVLGSLTAVITLITAFIRWIARAASGRRQ